MNSFTEFWTSADGHELLARAKETAQKCDYDIAKTILALSGKALKAEESAQMALAAEIVVARRLAAPWGDWTADGFFTRKAVQQASQPSIAEHRAARFTGCRSVLEIGTGIGIDAAAIARQAGQVTSLEPDETLASMTEYNLALRGIGNVTVLRQRLDEFFKSSSGLSGFDGLWSDPSRRTSAGERIFNPEKYSPPLGAVMALEVGGIRGIKISPGVNLGNLPSPWVREWLGVKDECLEQVLWVSPDVRNGEACLADLGLSWAPKGSGATAPVWDGTKDLKGFFLVEPHPVLIRTEALGEFFAEHDISFLAPEIAYGIREEMPSESAWYSSFSVIEVISFSERALRARLMELRWDSRTEIKKRGFPETPDAIRKRLALPRPAPGTQAGVVFLTRQGAKHLAILATRAPEER